MSECKNSMNGKHKPRDKVGKNKSEYIVCVYCNKILGEYRKIAKGD